MKIAIGADHRGYLHKESIQAALGTMGIEVIDVGAYSDERSDYPDFAVAAVNTILKGEAARGILICGTGIGMSIAANRFYGIYAGLAWNNTVAQKAKEEDNINILVLPADFISQQESVEMVSTWLTAPFKGGHYQDRINKVEEIGGIKSPS